MTYRFVTKSQNYAGYASGHVFYGAPGHPAFPIRLASEIFQRCLAIRSQKGLNDPVTLYDPCCGGAYHLSILAYLHWRDIHTIIGSDIDEEILSTAGRNLGLLTQAGLKKREQEIATMVARYGKPSHQAALASVKQFAHQLDHNRRNHQVTTRLFVVNVMNPKALVGELEGQEIDVVIADVPYGRHATWQGVEEGIAAQRSALWQMLDALSAVLSTKSVVAIAADKKQKCNHERYKQVGRFQIGKRQVFLLQPDDVLQAVD